MIQITQQYRRLAFIISCILGLLVYWKMFKNNYIEENINMTHDFIVPFINYVPGFFVSPENKLVACEIRKSMSQLTTNLMCLLYNETQFVADKNTLNDTWEAPRHCMQEHSFTNFSDDLKNDTDTVKFAFIRDPIRRFLSFYLNNKSECYDCGSDMRCVVERIYNGLWNIQNDRNMTFILMEAHAAPLSWNCGFNEGVSKWELLMMGSDLDERTSSTTKLAKILRKQGVRHELVESIEKDILKGETAHSTFKSTNRLAAEKQIREDPVVRYFLHKIYFFDYVVFPFKRDVLDPEYRSIFATAPAKVDIKFFV
eukprot:NP_493102.1 Uncharacterized protein CELE_F56H6.13 [Caenorhabditis elegans]